ncbi:MAG: ABC transporter substrate-binding protein [Proteobacteria bacterium]|nr:ABC transporter substrate-binding protein [Pseudomonadota bacterium]
MRKPKRRIALALMLMGLPAVMAGGVLAAETPRRGGVLSFVVPAAGPPSYDAHRETTFATIHPIAPFYSVLIRVNPENPTVGADFVCDLCVGMPKPTDGGKRYAFKIRKNVRFHDGSKLAARDIVASFNKIIFPPKGVISRRKAQYSMVKRVHAPGDDTVVFELKYPSAAFIPALANPFNFIYAKRILDEDIHWYENNIMGSGPFRFKEARPGGPGAYIEGMRNPAYYLKGKPYLAGFRAIFENQQSKRVEAIRKGTAMIEFRGFPPDSRDKLMRTLESEITVQESDWNCASLVTPNHKAKPFDDPRVRRALTLAIDRWGGSRDLSSIAIVKTVGGAVFPGDGLAATKKELEQIAGYWPDIEKSRAEARRLLKEAGYPNGVSFTLHNRATDQPYKILGAWLIGQWQKVGFKVEHWVQTTKPFLSTLQIEKDFEVSLHGYCGSVINPLLDVARLTSDDRSATNYGNYRDRVLDRLFDEMNRSADPAARRRIMRKFEKRALDDQAHQLPILWWRRIVPHRSIVRGWKISPSHYLNQDLGNVWLAE